VVGDEKIGLPAAQKGYQCIVGGQIFRAASATLFEQVFQNLAQHRVVFDHGNPKGRQIQHQTKTSRE